jgi:membrane-associated phospholipid phosphatase
VRAAEDTLEAGRSARSDWLGAGLVGTGIVLASGLLDNTAFRLARDHQGGAMRGLVRVGDALPFVGIGAAALLALDGHDPVRSRTSFSAVEAGASAFVATTGLKRLVGRARPEAGEGSHSFHAGSSEDRFQSFPSRHAAVAWAVATPYALQYDAYWPYALAGVTTLARVGSKEHWLSDSVGGSLLGYGLGRVFWESNNSRHKDAPRFMLRPDGVTVGWDLQ